MDAYESLNQEGLDYDSAKDLLDNHIRGLEFEQDGLDDEIVISPIFLDETGGPVETTKPFKVLSDAAMPTGSHAGISTPRLRWKN